MARQLYTKKHEAVKRLKTVCIGSTMFDLVLVNWWVSRNELKLQKYVWFNLLKTPKDWLQEVFKKICKYQK